MAKKAAVKEKKAGQKPRFFSLRSRYLSYILVLLGGITADIGVLIINSGKTVLSLSLIITGGIVLIFSLYLIAQDRFHLNRGKIHKI